MTIDDIETKTETFDTEFEIKQVSEETDDDGEFGFFEGFAATFGNIDLVNDRLEPGAFTKTLKQNDGVFKLLWQHRSSNLIGKIVEAKETKKGLQIKGRINLGTALGKEAFALLKARDIDRMSIGFQVKNQDFERDTGTRIITEIKLFEVSLVTFPANPKAAVTDVKSIEEAESLSDIENILHNKGFTNNESKAIISQIKAFISQRDADKEGKDQNQRDAEDGKGGQCDVELSKEVFKTINDIKHIIKGKENG